jgi:hypothetical protein
MDFRLLLNSSDTPACATRPSVRLLAASGDAGHRQTDQADPYRGRAWRAPQVEFHCGKHRLDLISAKVNNRGQVVLY